MKKKTPPVQVIVTTFKTDKGSFDLYHLVEDMWLRRILGLLNVKELSGRPTAAAQKRAFMNAINHSAGSRVVFISKEALLKDLDKKLHQKLKSNLPMGNRILKM